MNTQRRGTTPPNNLARAVTNSLRVESPSTTNDSWSEPRPGRRMRVCRTLIHKISAALPPSALILPGAPGTGLVLF